MTSSAPVVRQFAWMSIFPQLGLMALLIAAAYLAGLRMFLVTGAGAYLVISLLLRRTMPWDHRIGMSFLQEGNYSQAVQSFLRSYEFLNRHRWIDDWRYITLLSSSVVSYREMALLNVAFSHRQLGDETRSREYYERVAREFPGSGLAAAALRMMDAAAEISPDDSAHSDEN